MSDYSDHRRRQRRRRAGRPDCRKTRRRVCSWSRPVRIRRRTRCPPDISDIFPSSYAQPGLFLARFAGAAAHAGRSAATVSAGADHGRRLEHHGHVGIARCAVRLRCLGRRRGRRLGCGRSVRNIIASSRTISTATSARVAGAVSDPARAARSEWPLFAGAMERAAIARGLAARSATSMKTARDGFFPMPVSQSDRRPIVERERLSHARGPSPAQSSDHGGHAGQRDALRRPSRHRRDRAHALARNENIDAHEVILSAGAIHSPAMLMRAGIGPAAICRRWASPPVADRRGVGRNLQNHPYLNLALTLPRQFTQDENLRHFALAGIRLSSGSGQLPAGRSDGVR